MELVHTPCTEPLSCPLKRVCWGLSSPPPQEIILIIRIVPLIVRGKKSTYPPPTSTISTIYFMKVIKTQVKRIFIPYPPKYPVDIVIFSRTKLLFFFLGLVLRVTPLVTTTNHQNGRGGQHQKPRKIVQSYSIRKSTRTLKSSDIFSGDSRRLTAHPSSPPS